MLHVFDLRFRTKIRMFASKQLLYRASTIFIFYALKLVDLTLLAQVSFKLYDRPQKFHNFLLLISTTTDPIPKLTIVQELKFSGFNSSITPEH